MQFDLTDQSTQHWIGQVLTLFQTHRSQTKVEELSVRQHEMHQQRHAELMQGIADLKQRIGGPQVQPMSSGSLPPLLPMAPAISLAPGGSVVSVRPAHDVSPEEPYSKYAPDMDVSVGCIPCTRAHLSTMAASLRRAAEDGEEENVTAAREEIIALLEYDLTPEKLSVTPEKDRIILAKYSGELASLHRELSGPMREMTVASASLKEALRFARADGVDHPEVRIRMARTEDAVNSLERVTLAPERIARLPAEQAEVVRQLLPEIREARQDLINHVYTADDLEQVSVRIAELDQALNPPPAPQKVEELADRARHLNDEFRRDVISAWTKGA